MPANMTKTAPPNRSIRVILRRQVIDTAQMSCMVISYSLDCERKTVESYLLVVE
jgi:hypothetical protein